MTKSSCMSTINGKLGVCGYLPGQALRHAVLNHLMECRGVLLFQGSCDSWRYCCHISWSTVSHYKIGKKKLTKGYLLSLGAMNQWLPIILYLDTERTHVGRWHPP
jgi:hypothetical protein